MCSSHIPYKFFKQIKSCGEKGVAGREGKREAEETYTKPSFSMLSHSHLEGWLFFPQYDGVSLITPFIRNSSHTAHTEVACCLHFRKILAMCKQLQNTHCGQRIKSHIFFNRCSQHFTHSMLTLCAYESLTETSTSMNKVPSRDREYIKVENMMPCPIKKH